MYNGVIVDTKFHGGTFPALGINTAIVVQALSELYNFKC